MPLKAKDMGRIVELQLRKVATRLQEKHISLEWDTNVVKHLAENGYDPLFGARPLKRLIQHEVVNLLANSLLEGKITPGSHIRLSGKKNGDEFIYSM